MWGCRVCHTRSDNSIEEFAISLFLLQIRDHTVALVTPWCASSATLPTPASVGITFPAFWLPPVETKAFSRAFPFPTYLSLPLPPSPSLHFSPNSRSSPRGLGGECAGPVAAVRGSILHGQDRLHVPSYHAAASASHEQCGQPHHSVCVWRGLQAREEALNVSKCLCFVYGSKAHPRGR